MCETGKYGMLKAAQDEVDKAIVERDRVEKSVQRLTRCRDAWWSFLLFERDELQTALDLLYAELNRANIALEDARFALAVARGDLTTQCDIFAKRLGQQLEAEVIRTPAHPPLYVGYEALLGKTQLRSLYEDLPDDELRTHLIAALDAALLRPYFRGLVETVLNPDVSKLPNFPEEK